MGQPVHRESRVSPSKYGAKSRAFNFRAAKDGLGVTAILTMAASIAMLAMILLAAPVRAEDPARIMLYGDSLLAGYGLADEHTVATKLDAALREKGQDVEIINASVSGDTTAGGVSRLDWALSDDPDLVILALGGNDILRAIDPANTRANLSAMMERFEAEGVPVLLAGMVAPKSLGPEYAEAFDVIYPELAAKHSAGFYPFLLEGVAGDRTMNQNDGIHPNPAGVNRIVEGLTPLVVEMLDSPDRPVASRP